MRTQDLLRHALVHSAYSGVGVDDHHVQPTNVEVSNTTLVVPPLPGGPGQWDIPVAFDAQAVMFTFRSNRTVELASAKAGVIGVATRSSLDASTFSAGGDVSIGTTAYAAIYTKVGAALYLSHKIFDSAGADIALSDVYLAATGPSTRVLRTLWTNFSAGNRTLNVWGEVGVLG